MQGPVPGTTQLKSSVQARFCVAGKQQGPGGQQDEHKLAVCCCSNEGRLDPGLHLQGHYLQR